MTRNNPFTVFVQTVARACIVCVIMPLIWHDPANEKWVFMAAIPWCIGEMVRYPFYEFKSLQNYLGHLRYNVFIPLYPIGVLGEIICFYQQTMLSEQLPPHQKPLTILMPNSLNVAIDFESLVRYVFPICYLVQFPPMYMYMVKQRQKFYSHDKT